MKYIKWKILTVTSVTCLLPILLGLSLWGKLPDTMAIHFDFYGNADDFAPKWIVVFALPLLMAALQVFCCFVIDINAHKHGEQQKIETVTKWIVPTITVALHIVTLGYSLGWNLDIRRIVAFIVGLLFIVLGSCLPKLNYIKNYDLDPEKARKINRFVGRQTVFMGVLFIVSVFLMPISTVVCIGLLIPYTIIGIVYGIIVGKK